MNKLLLLTTGLILATGTFSQNKPASTSKPRGNVKQAQKNIAASQSSFQKPKYHYITRGKIAKKAKGG